MTDALAPYTPPQGVTLVDIRMDSQRFPRIKNLLAPYAVRRLSGIILAAYTYTGRPSTQERCDLVADSLYGELIADRKGLGTANISIEEVGHAVKSAILNTDGDIYISISFLYKAVCAYCLGEGQQANDEAYRRKVASRQQALAATPAGAMLESYTGAALQQMTRK